MTLQKPLLSETRRAVFLDRDGVVNESVVLHGKPYPPQNLDQLIIVDGAETALRSLKARGFVLIVVTNQPDVARGAQTRAVVEKINAHLHAHLPLDDIFVCYHDDQDGCACRKPKPGLLLDAAKKFGVALRASYLIGDRWRDIEAGVDAGCRTVWIDRSYDEARPTNHNARVTTLEAACKWILDDGDAE